MCGCSMCHDCRCGSEEGQSQKAETDLLVLSQVANETLHTDRPDLPECFQLSVLSWLPCIYLWAVCPIYLFYLKRNNKGYIMMSIMNRFKTVSVQCFFLLKVCYDETLKSLAILYLNVRQIEFSTLMVPKPVSSVL